MIANAPMEQTFVWFHLGTVVAGIIGVFLVGFVFGFICGYTQPR